MTSKEKQALFQSLPVVEQREQVSGLLFDQIEELLKFGVPPIVIMDAFRAIAVTTWMNEPTAPATFRALADELEREQQKQKSLPN